MASTLAFPIYPDSNRTTASRQPTRRYTVGIEPQATHGSGLLIPKNEPDEKKNAVLKADGPRIDGTMHQNMGCRTTSDRVQYIKAMPRDGLTLVID